MKKDNKIILLVIVLSITLLVVGCRKKPQKPDMGNNNMEGNIYNSRQKATDRIGGDYRLNNRVADEDTDNMNLSKRAERIAEKVANMKEVNSSTVVITNRTAIVGVNIKNNIEGNLTTNLKRSIEKMVKNTDNMIETVTVTADADIYKRLNNIATDVRNGRPLSGFADEVQEILRRITPNM